MKYSSFVTVVVSICIIVLILLVIIGNLLVIIVILVDRRLKTVQYQFYMSLTVADLLIGLSILPFSLIKELFDFWIFSQWLCTFWLSMDVLLCTASILSLCLISIDRYLSISRPTKYNASYGRTPKNAVLMILCIWFLSILICLPSFLIHKNADKLHNFSLPNSTSIVHNNANEYECKLNDDVGYVIYSIMGSFFIPMTLILTVNARIYYLVKKRSKNSFQISNTCEPKLHKIEMKSVGVYEDCSTQQKLHPKEMVQNRKLRQHRQRERRATLVLGLILSAFLICWLPFFGTYLLTLYCANCISETLFDFFFWLGYCNSAINPIIYTVFNKDFREALKSVVCTKIIT